MANKLGNVDEDSLESLREDLDFSCSKSKSLIRWVNPQQALVLGLVKDSIFKPTHGSAEFRIPKPVLGLDEKYLRRCLESIHLRAATITMARCNVSEKIMGFSGPSEATTGDGSGLVFECPAAVGGAGSVVLGPAGPWILGSIMGSKSMTNILRSPLLNQYGASDCVATLTRLNSRDANGQMRFDYVESPSVLSVSSSPLPVREAIKYDSDCARKKRVSVSSTNSACSDQTSSTASAAIGQAMLQCTWKSGVPHFVFSTDDQKDVFVANLWKVEASDEKALDYLYSFHSGKSGSKDHEISDGQSRLVGKMKVSNSFTISANNSKTLETEFVLFGGNGGHTTDIPTSSHFLGKHKGLPRKVVDVFRSSKNISKFSGPCPIQENCSGDDPDMGPTLSDDCPPPNLELAAIVVKDRIVDAQKDEPGGWGLKFLKKRGVERSSRPMESSSFGLECNRNNDDCSTSMDILIPAGLHGGPRTGNGGPYSLTERWKSGGRCDCGGWDIGCPLMVLKPKPNKDEAHIHEEFKSVDFVTQGSDHGSPTLRLVNVQDDLYFVHFQRTLSILQSFSIAVAVIHARSPTLRPEMYTN